MAFIPLLIAGAASMAPEALSAMGFTATAASLAPFAAGMGMLGAGLSAVGALQQGNETAKMDKYNEAVQAQRAQQALSVSSVQAGQDQLQTRSMIANQQAAFAAGGLDMAGSPLLVMSSTASQGALKAALTRWQGETEATSDLQTGRLDSMQAAAAQSAGYTNAGSTLLSGLSSTYRNYYGGVNPPNPAGTSPAASGYIPGPQSLI